MKTMVATYSALIISNTWIATSFILNDLYTSIMTLILGWIWLLFALILFLHESYLSKRNLRFKEMQRETEKRKFEFLIIKLNEILEKNSKTKTKPKTKTKVLSKKKKTYKRR